MTQKLLVEAAQPLPSMRSALQARWLRGWLGAGLVYILMTALAFVFMIPLFWMLSTSLKPRWEIMAWPPQWIPSDPQWQNYSDAFTRYPMGRFMLNSGLLVVANVIGELLAVPLVAYGFARLRFPGKGVLFMIVIVTMMIPTHAMLIPLFTIYQRLHLIDSYWPLILPAYFGGPFFIFLLVQYMKTLPRDLDDAARIDGAGTWAILYRVLLPLCNRRWRSSSSTPSGGCGTSFCIHSSFSTPLSCFQCRSVWPCSAGAIALSGTCLWRRRWSRFCRSLCSISLCRNS
jgi:ABC-type glycerol-3-phosphate transport system permease component